MEDIKSIEIPHKRILEINRHHFEMNFRRLNANGDTPNYGEQVYLAIRYRDEKVFKMAEFIPANSGQTDCVYLEEL